MLHTNVKPAHKLKVTVRYVPLLKSYYERATLSLQFWRLSVDNIDCSLQAVYTTPQQS